MITKYKTLLLSTLPLVDDPKVKAVNTVRMAGQLIQTPGYRHNPRVRHLNKKTKVIRRS